MNEYSPGVSQNQPPRSDTTDDHALLGALLQRLEQADNLTLDELDAVIAQADAAYKRRLARLERTREMVNQLGKTVADT